MIPLKRLLFLSILLIFIPLNAYAISLETLQSNPTKYIKLGEYPTSTYYFEQNSIKVLRNSFPYLTLQAKVYLVMYDQLAIADDSFTVSYDCNRSLPSLAISKAIESPNITTHELTDYAIAEAKKDSGIVVNINANNYYQFDGTITTNGSPIVVLKEKAKFETVLYSIANKIFYHHNQCREYFFAGM